MEFINVNDTLPNNNQLVIIAYYPNYLKGKGVVIPAKYEEGKFLDMKSEWFLNVNQREIRYWQPMPKAPN